MHSPSVGNVVHLRDGRWVWVSDSSDTDPDAWRTYDKSHYERTGEFKVTSENPPETILIGTRVFDAFTSGAHFGGTVVTDWSEVKHVVKGLSVTGERTDG